MKNSYFWIVVIGVTTVIAAGVWFLFLQGGSQAAPASSGSTLGVGDTRSTSVGVNDTSNTGQGNVSAQVLQKTVFAVANGPVAGATLIQTLHPTTTIARYVTGDNGHVFDLVLDSPGSVPRAVSNTTIPGVVQALWTESGQGAVLQYVDSGVVKTVHLGFPAAATTSSVTLPVKIQFLPDAIADITVSPDGKSVAYLLDTASGSDGYVSKPDGTGSKRLFSLPLSEILISWTSQNTLLAQTKSASGVTGAIFSINAANGNVVPLLFAPGVTALGDKAGVYVLYQTSSAGGSVASYVHNLQKNSDKLLSFKPYPEKCSWSMTVAAVVYCAAPLQYVPAAYLDLWHQGADSASDSIFAFNLATGVSTVLATPGGDSGGVLSDISTLRVSPDDHYLLFIKKGDRSLWGVRLTP